MSQIENIIFIQITSVHKVSALEVESQLLEHPLISDVCVVGVPDPKWGQRVAALVVRKSVDNTTTKAAAAKDALSLDELRDWCKSRMASYQIPTIVKQMKQIPKNMIGKPNKKEIVRDYFPSIDLKILSKY